MAEITPKVLKDLCRKQGLYNTPHLNDKLYLHYKGFRVIQNLQEYTGLRVLWLEGNGLERVEGLEAQADMRTLYLQENLIERIENLEHMVRGCFCPAPWRCLAAPARPHLPAPLLPPPPAKTLLSSLNLGKNRIGVLENLSALTQLGTLNVAHNLLGSVAGCADIAHLAACPSITCLDLQENKLAEPEVLDVLAAMPNLAVLYLQGNPAVKRIRFYRKHVIGRLPGLKYLDDRPIFPDERARCDVWYRVFCAEGEAAAAAAERVEIDRLAKEKADTEQRNFEAFATFTARAAAGDPLAFQSFQPEWQAANGGVGPGVESCAGGGAGAPASSEAEAKKEEEEEEEEEELDDAEEEEEEEESSPVPVPSSASASASISTSGCAVSAAMLSESKEGAEARAELWGKVLAAAGAGGGASPPLPQPSAAAGVASSSAAGCTALDELE